MTNTMYIKSSVTLAILLIALLGFSVTASANHSGDEEEASHTTTVGTEDSHDDSDGHAAITVTSVSGGDASLAQMENLIAMLQQLIVLLTSQLEHQNVSDDENDDDHGGLHDDSDDDHDDDEGEDHDDDNEDDEDEDNDHDEDSHDDHDDD